MNHVSESVLMLADRGISVVVSTNSQSLTKTSLIADLLSEQCALAAISTPSDLLARVQMALHQASGAGRLRFTIVADCPTGVAGILHGAASSLFVNELVKPSARLLNLGEKTVFSKNLSYLASYLTSFYGYAL